MLHIPLGLAIGAADTRAAARRKRVAKYFILEDFEDAWRVLIEDGD